MMETVTFFETDYGPVKAPLYVSVLLQDARRRRDGRPDRRTRLGRYLATLLDEATERARKEFMAGA